MTELFLGIFILLFLVFLLKPNIGLYLLAFFLPVIGFEMSFYSFSFPIIDFIALILLLAFLTRLAYYLLFEPKKDLSLKFPLFLPFFLFLVASLISVFFSADVHYSLWYFCRWPLFLYTAYIFVPYNLINNQKTLKRMIITLSFSSFLVLLFGFLSLYGQDWQNAFFRIRSISIAGIFPFGENHNLIAEFLNVGTFFVLALSFLAKDKRFQKFLNILFIFFTLGVILTFSRTAWLVLILQLSLYFIFLLRNKNWKVRDFIIPAIIMFIIISPLFIKMNRLQEENVSSTENRVLLTEIGFDAFKEKPVTGYGSGYFIRLVDNNIRFKAKYGEAIDSHGVLQKILAENGIFAFLAWIFLIIYIIKEFIVAAKKHASKNLWLIPLILGSIGGLFFQFLNTSYYKGKVWLPIVLTLLAIKILDNESRKVKKD